MLMEINEVMDNVWKRQYDSAQSEFMNWLTQRREVINRIESREKIAVRAL